MINNNIIIRVIALKKYPVFGTQRVLLVYISF